MALSEKIDNSPPSRREAMVLKKLYYDIGEAAGYTAVANLFREGKLAGLKDLNINKVKHFLSTQDTYTKHRPVYKTFPRDRVLSFHKFELLQMDIIDMQEFRQRNNGHNYILSCICVFSKIGWLRPLKTKGIAHVTPAAREIFKIAKNTLLQTDRGTEFLNKSFAQMTSELGIKHYVTKDPVKKAAVCER